MAILPPGATGGLPTSAGDSSQGDETTSQSSTKFGSDFSGIGGSSNTLPSGATGGLPSSAGSASQGSSNTQQTSTTIAPKLTNSGSSKSSGGSYSSGREGELQKIIDQNSGNSKKDVERRKQAKAELQAIYSERDAQSRAAAEAKAAIEGDAALRASRAAENAARNKASASSGSGTGSSAITNIERATTTKNYSDIQAGETVEQYRKRVGGRGEYVGNSRFSGGKVSSEGSSSRQAVLNSITGSFSDLDTKESRSKGVREYNADKSPQGLVFDPSSGNVYAPEKGQSAISYTVLPNRVSREQAALLSGSPELEQFNTAGEYFGARNQQYRPEDSIFIFTQTSAFKNPNSDVGERFTTTTRPVTIERPVQAEPTNPLPFNLSQKYDPFSQDRGLSTVSTDPVFGANLSQYAGNPFLNELQNTPSRLADTVVLSPLRGVGKSLIFSGQNFKALATGNFNNFAKQNKNLSSDPDVQSAAFYVATLGLGAVLPTVAKAAYAGFGALTAYDTVVNPPKLGEGAYAERLLIVGGGALAAKNLAQAGLRRGISLFKNEIPATEISTPEIQALGGKEKFPTTDSVPSALADFEATKTLGSQEYAGYVKAVTSSPEGLKSNLITGNVISADVVPRNKYGSPIESVGINAAAYGKASFEFLKIAGEKSPDTFKISLLPPLRDPIPTASVILADRVKPVPSSVANQLGYAPEAAFLEANANKGTLYIPKRSLLSIDSANVKDTLAGIQYRGGTNELQANVAPTTSLTLLQKPTLLERFAGYKYGFNDFTKVNGQIVPLPTFLSGGSRPIGGRPSIDAGFFVEFKNPATAAQSRSALDIISRDSSSLAKNQRVITPFTLVSDSSRRQTAQSSSPIIRRTSSSASTRRSASGISNIFSSLTSQSQQYRAAQASKPSYSRYSRPSRTIYGYDSRSYSNPYGNSAIYGSSSGSSSRPIAKSSTPSTPRRDVIEGTKKERKIILKQPKTRYTPSLVALALNLKGKITRGVTDQYTGLGLRPIPISKKGRKNALKKAFGV